MASFGVFHRSARRAIEVPVWAGSASARMNVVGPKGQEAEVHCTGNQWWLPDLAAVHDDSIKGFLRDRPKMQNHFTALNHDFIPNGPIFAYVTRYIFLNQSV